MGVLQEFREFAVKGNVLDMAVGILVGVAFNSLVNSLVNDILMPPVGMLVSGVEFKHLELVLRPAATGAEGEVLPTVAIRYGAFVNTLIEFLIISFSAFVAVKVMNRVLRARLRDQ
ncbi:MAG: large conductance mechanosensitive channel protein MscL [Gammaproteobacteria bacterium]|nr:large conductance mechanosensitive channel protein MscL [Gammaproteobacteria bacterium]NIR82325.1 large conductance mechanosensitive channel protein MscL [Gammaproteobacteria bacterium]NIV76463.1 large conductance mechanosensitive channel protein MscL [Gammaproteobacteria bacterium]